LVIESFDGGADNAVFSINSGSLLQLVAIREMAMIAITALLLSNRRISFIRY